MKQNILLHTAFSSIALLPSLAMAHSGHLSSQDFGIVAGLVHPFTGLDHLTMFIGAGIMLGLGRKSPATALLLTAGLTVGIVLGSFMHASAIIEYSVAFSLLALAAVMSFKKVNKFTIALLPFMATLHGLAHGTEIPAGAALGFTMGSALSATFIVFSGFFFAKLLATKKWFRTSAVIGILGAFGAILGTS